MFELWRLVWKCVLINNVSDNGHFCLCTLTRFIIINFCSFTWGCFLLTVIALIFSNLILFIMIMLFGVSKNKYNFSLLMVQFSTFFFFPNKNIVRLIWHVLVTWQLSYSLRWPTVFDQEREKKNRCLILCCLIYWFLVDLLFDKKDILKVHMNFKGLGISYL